MMQKKVLFVTFEGGDKCGKSTQIALLAKRLKRLKVPVKFLREPGGTPLGEEIRNILLHRHDYQLSSFVEFQLFTTARKQLVREVILPFLKQNKRGVLILDRFFDSTYVYQGIAGGLDIRRYEAYEKASRAGLVPDITFLMDLSYAEARKRGKSHKKDRMEKKSALFHEKVRQGFLNRARMEKKRFRVLDASKNIEVLKEEILKAVEKKLGRI